MERVTIDSNELAKECETIKILLFESTNKSNKSVNRCDELQTALADLESLLQIWKEEKVDTIDFER